MTLEQANAVYDILQQECGAADYWRDNFVFHQTDAEPCREYRFQGLLGFGGKFRRSTDRGWYVDYYPEDRTPERDAMVEAANVRLKRLYETKGESNV